MNANQGGVEARIRARAAAMRAAVLEQIPEARPFIAELVKAELIDGWRNVMYVGPPRDLGGITADRLQLRTKGEHR